MLLLEALLATAAWSYVFAQEIPVQSPISITKFQKSARMTCEIQTSAASVDDIVIHWYQHKEGKSPERLLFYSGGKISVESGFEADRYMIETVSSQNRCVFTIKDVTSDDAATYYCAYWDPHCDRNSKIIKAKKPPPSTSEPQDYGYAQGIPMQKPPSLTKNKGSVRLECHFTDVSEYVDGTVIHWYQQKENKAPVRMLYLAQSKVVDDGFQAYRYMVEKVPGQKTCILTINDVTPDDAATYYCAYWDSHCDKVPSSPASSEILQKRHENQIIYVCLIEKFYPEVIRVTWTDEARKEITDNIVKGDVWKPTNGDKYSIGSWLTVPVENKGKNYYCNYEHENKQESLSTQDSTKTATQQKDCITGNSTVYFNRDHLMHRTAYLVYIVLLLKSSMYYLIVLFLIYRMWAPTKHQGKKA